MLALFKLMAASSFITMFKKLLHLIPFMHFYTPWSDPKDCHGYAGNERQQRFCTVCNKKKYRMVKNYPMDLG